VESSDNFTDEQYKELKNRNCDDIMIVMFIWVEVPVDFLIADKSYFFFRIQ
jgi:hypothetical protein